jgi:hypothetical protein
MTKPDPGRREYTVGTERALYTFSGMACYFPDCLTPVIVFVNGEPVCNVQIAHVRGANPNSPRYDPSMTDAERRAFTNLILLCTPHHTIVDRLHAADYPPEELQLWKVQREADAGIDNIALSSLTEDRLVELIERAVRSSRLERTVALELGLGVSTGRQLLSMPPARAKDYFDGYNTDGVPLVILTVRNRGGLKAYVESHRICITPPGLKIAVNEFPNLNPNLPSALDVGESRFWLYRLNTIVAAVHATRAVEIGGADMLIGEASLGSGETVTTPRMPAHYLGFGC